MPYIRPVEYVFPPEKMGLMILIIQMLEEATSVHWHTEIYKFNTFDKTLKILSNLEEHPLKEGDIYHICIYNNRIRDIIKYTIYYPNCYSIGADTRTYLNAVVEGVERRWTAAKLTYLHYKFFFILESLGGQELLKYEEDNPIIKNEYLLWLEGKYDPTIVPRKFRMTKSKGHYVECISFKHWIYPYLRNHIYTIQVQLSASGFPKKL